MKKIAFLIIGIIFITLPAFSQWFLQPTPTTKHLNSIFILNQTTLFATGEFGVVLKSSNLGTNWIKLRESTENWRMYGIWFQNENTGIAAGGINNNPRVGIIFRTTNGGNSWDSIIFNGICFRGLNFINSYTGFAGGWTMSPSSSPIYKTTNSGLNWFQITPFNSFGIENFYFLNEYKGFATGDMVGSEVVFKTVDGGSNWNNISNFSIYTIWLCSVVFVNENTGWITGWQQVPFLGGLLRKTTDGGDNWVHQNNNSTNLLYEQFYINENTGWVVGEPELIQKTTNGGINWILQSCPPAWWMWDVKFLNENTGWTAGSQGKIFHTTNGGGPVSVQNISTEIPSSFSLSQNYPNPFNNTSKLKFEIANLENVKIVVFDVMGREVQTLVNERLQPGTYEVTFNGSSLNSGVYFYRLTSGNFTGVKKMVLLK